MNRETKRRLAKQGQLGEDGNPRASTDRPRPQPGGAARRNPNAPRDRSRGEFFREVRGELKKVAWPTRAETMNYATVVLISLVVLVSLIFVLDYLFAKSILFLFKT